MRNNDKGERELRTFYSNVNNLQRAGRKCKERRTKETSAKIKSKAPTHVHDEVAQGCPPHYTHIYSKFYVIRFPIM
jgi:hypothetical protein